nr:hypothetical protein GCM10010200_028080 [Actinomadura rugatobispora]
MTKVTAAAGARPGSPGGIAHVGREGRTRIDFSPCRNTGILALTGKGSCFTGHRLPDEPEWSYVSSTGIRPRGGIPDDLRYPFSCAVPAVAGVVSATHRTARYGNTTLRVAVS